MLPSEFHSIVIFCEHHYTVHCHDIMVKVQGVSSKPPGLVENKSPGYILSHS